MIGLRSACFSPQRGDVWKREDSRQKYNKTYPEHPGHSTRTIDTDTDQKATNLKFVFLLSLLRSVSLTHSLYPVLLSSLLLSLTEIIIYAYNLKPAAFLWKLAVPLLVSSLSHSLCSLHPSLSLSLFLRCSASSAFIYGT